MAHVAKVKLPAVAPMVGHYERAAEARGYARENVDTLRTSLNYACGFAGGREPHALARAVRERVAGAREGHEMASGRALRKDANVLMDWVVTRPQDCPEGLTDRFFETVVAFVQERYGRENAPGGFVHMDETTPHVHIPVVPVRDGRLVASRVVDRADLRTFHADLGRAVDRALGVHVSVELDERRRGERQLSRLGQDEYRAARARLARAEESARRADAEASRSRQEAEIWAERAKGARKAANAAKEAQTASERARDAAMGEMQRLGGTVGKARAEVERLRGEAVALGDEVSGLEGRRDDLRGEVGALEAAAADLERRVERARDALEAMLGDVERFLGHVWDRLMEAWRSYGPWSWEQSADEIDRAIDASARDYGMGDEWER